ncbi:hypothetical protein GCM10007916_11700 [Psychromonas marina]|uniref:DUF2846 domain-containing protein n=1 Tax=Psychromonas marina TaxID=88364 RepID=A0ABQ6DZ09_9GAMM|nr:DUF2846 domain-containing protein [Psychromonas marina]GLS90103.1 hypothetical protein GCM10007916_11700 [Psychromonas marina]
MKKVLLATIVTSVILSGCSSVPMESKELTQSAQSFSVPSVENSGIYVYRKNTMVGAALKKDVFIDGACIGETAPGIFFYQEVAGNKPHTISTESEFSNNDLVINAESGQLYFVEQYIKMGAFVGGAGLQAVDEKIGKEEVLKSHLAKAGTCSL